MKLHLLFFSILRDITGSESVEFTLDSGSTVASLLVALYQRWPELGKWDASLLVAVDQSYVKREAVLHEGAEVAIMPPVQGG